MRQLNFSMNKQSKKIAAIFDGMGFAPADDYSMEFVRKFVKNGQMCVITVELLQDIRSYRQLRTYWGCVNQLVLNTGNDPKIGWPDANTAHNRLKLYVKDDTDQSIMIKQWYWAWSPKHNEFLLMPEYRSLSFANCHSKRANKYITGAIEYIADALKVTKQKLLEMIGG